MGVRVVVTGMGAISSLGRDAAQNWQSMRSGRCGIGPLSIADMDDLKVSIAGQIAELPEHDLDRRQLATMAKFALLAVLCAGEALGQAGLDARAMDASRIGTVIGTGVYGGDAMEEAYREIFLERKKRTNIYTVPKAMPVSPAVHVSMIHGLKGPTFGVTSACASANHAFSTALDLIRSGRADVIVAGGTDVPLTYGTLKAWEAMRVLARTGCRPFSADREGLVLGDGAGVLVLESLEHAEKRGAPILAELAGAGLSADAGDIVAPTLQGPISAIRACLSDGGLAPEDIDYVNAHGTATLANDRTETQAIREVFGSVADGLSVSSTKSMHAHCLGASAALEAIACVNAIRESIIPPTIGYNQRDPECDLDVTPNVARERPVRAAISNAFAFGGANSVIAFKRFG